ncbi:phosphatidylglycerophosphatase and protein-tyrosine phosphatase 1-like isoform X2 [Lineus longissimus]
MSGWFPKAFFFPTLAYNVLMEKLTSRAWYSRIDETVLLGALPFRSMTDELVENENVKGVITMNEDYETRYFVNTAEEWEKFGVRQLRLDTMDMIAAPSQENLTLGVRFINEIKKTTGGSVYVHCKAGRTRSATVVACYIMETRRLDPEAAFEFVRDKRPHIWIRETQWEAIRTYYANLCKNHPTGSAV